MLTFLAKPQAQPEPVLEITIDEAFQGVAGEAEVAVVGRIGLRLPAGLRDGELVEIDTGRGGRPPLTLRIRVRAEPGRAIQGDDLRLTVPVDPKLIEDGGRVEVETPVGPRVLWAPRGLPPGALLKLRDCGLPARDDRPQGHAFVRLEPDPALAGRRARVLLDRFAATWVADAPRLRRAG